MIKQKFFYLNTKGRVFGPLTAAQLRKMYLAGRLSAGDTVSADKVRWQSAEALFSPGNANRQQRSVDIDTITISDKDLLKPDDDSPASDLLPPKISGNDEDILYSLQKASAGKFAAVVTMMLLFLGGICTGIYFYMQGPGKNISLKTRIDEKNVSSNNLSDTGTSDPGTGKNDQSSGSDAGDRSWSSIIDSKRNAVGAVFVEIIDRNNSLTRHPIGTAWAIGPDSFASNAHVIYGIKNIYKQLPPQKYREFRIVVVTDEVARRYPITEVKIHPQYKDSTPINMESDFAILKTVSPVKNVLTLAGKDELLALKPGMQIAYLGFPTDGLQNQNINVNSPVATFHAGDISAVSDSAFGNSGQENNTLIRHNLPTVGGASGSPIFARNGKVIAILFAGTMHIRYNEKGQIYREPSAAMVNLAIRIDRIQACIDSKFVKIEDFLRN